jgi:hypothetical protein
VILWTILAALLGAVAGFAAAGFGAAAILTSALGSQDGGPAMAGFFGFGPIGAIAGALLGAGSVMWFGKGSPGWGRGLMISAAVVFAMGGVLLAFVSHKDDRPSYTYVIEFELEYPAATLASVDIPSPNAMWGSGGPDTEAHPISKFFDKKCSGDLCVVNGSVAALGPTKNFKITAAIGQKKYLYVLGLPAAITAATDWSEWRDGDGARSRWRITKP